MIKVVYYRNFNRVVIEGHAKSGEAGHDLVCAATSALAYTLATNVAHMKKGGCLRIAPQIKLESGDAEIRCAPRRRFKATATLIFDTICVGFEMLAQQYPQNISYEIK